jgi:Trk-type K+ transport system membrane component
LYTMRRLLPDNDFFVDLRGAFDFLLKHPRRCYTNLFPSAHTWWLLCSVVILNGIDWIAFEVLNVGRLKTIWLGVAVSLMVFHSLITPP